ncbi:MAG: hypothetical protein KF819_09665 [Labilithrix sp.]|nr:hypothetical protein [Labilithrix sp.]
MNVRRLFALTFLVACSCGAVVACSDAAERQGFPDDDGGSASLPPEASVPEASDEDARAPFDPADRPVVCADAGACAVELVAGDRHFCARMSDGTVQCWGDDELGSLGRGVAQPVGADASVPPRVAPVKGVAGATEIGAAGETSCALASGAVWCWGANKNAELSAPSDYDPHPDAARVALGALGDATRLDVGHGSICARLSSGQLACWGKDDEQQLARSQEDAGVWPIVRAPGVAAIGALPVARVKTGSHTTLALTPTGELWTWGAVSGDEGLVSGRVSSISPALVPKRVARIASVTSLAVSATVVDEPGGGHGGPWFGLFPWPEPEPRAHACAIASGEVYCWGKSEVGALCTGMPDVEKEPAHARIGVKAWPQRVAVADEITCVRMTDGTIQCCGSDRKGRLGTGSVALYAPSFVPASAFTGRAVQVATSHDAVCALLEGGGVECWGSNAHGELGRAPDDEDHPSPVKITFQVTP